MAGTVDEIVTANRRYVEGFPGEASALPRQALTVVACMDARIDVAGALGLEPGDAHILRNGGGLVTEDVIRSLCLSQRLLGTRTVVLVHHTDCGLEGVSDEEFAAALESEVGHRPEWRAGGFTDVDAAVRASIRRLEESAFLVHRDAIAGFVYHTDTGRLRRVERAG